MNSKPSCGKGYHEKYYTKKKSYFLFLLEFKNQNILNHFIFNNIFIFICLLHKNYFYLNSTEITLANYYRFLHSIQSLLSSRQLMWINQYQVSDLLWSNGKDILLFFSNVLMEIVSTGFKFVLSRVSFLHSKPHKGASLSLIRPAGANIFMLQCGQELWVSMPNTLLPSPDIVQFTWHS